MFFEFTLAAFLPRFYSPTHLVVPPPALRLSSLLPPLPTPFTRPRLVPLPTPTTCSTLLSPMVAPCHPLPPTHTLGATLPVLPWPTHQGTTKTIFCRSVGCLHHLPPLSLRSRIRRSHPTHLVPQHLPTPPPKQPLHPPPSQQSPPSPPLLSLLLMVPPHVLSIFPLCPLSPRNICHSRQRPRLRPRTL